LERLMSVIPVFVASTLRDFHQERDRLRRHIAPRLSDEVAEAGCRVEFVDLRWGATDAGLPEDEREAQILTVCGREIDRARPIMLGLIGTSYGRPFRRDRFSSDHLARLPDEIRDRIGSISVTEFELLYGLHASSTTEVVLLARQLRGTAAQDWRDNEPAAIELQRRLRRSDRVAFRPYRASIDADGRLDLTIFEREVVKVLLPRIRRRAAELQSGDAYRDAERLLLEECGDPVGLDAIRAELLDRLRKGRTALIATPRVAGKTALFAGVVKDLRADGRKVVSASIGVGPVNTLGDLVAVLFRQLTPGATQWNFAEDAAHFSSIIDGDIGTEPSSGSLSPEMLAQKRLVIAVTLGSHIAELAQQSAQACIAVDGVDRMTGSHEDRALAWRLLEPVRNAPGVGLLYTTDVAPSDDVLELVEVPRLAPDAAAQMIQELARRSGRIGVPAEVIDIVRRRERTPLWVSTVYGLIDGLSEPDLAIPAGGDWAEALEQVLVDAVASLPEDDEGVVLGAVERLAAADRADVSSVTLRLLEVLALAHRGLTALALGEALGIARSDVSSIRYRLGGLVVESGADRAVRIAHPSVGRLIATRIEPDRAVDIHARVARALLSLCGTRQEAVALVRHGLSAHDPGLAAQALNRAVQVMDQIGPAQRSSAADLVSTYFDVVTNGPTAIDVDALDPAALAVVVDVVLRRLDNGYSVAPSHEEWPFLDALVARVEGEDSTDRNHVPRSVVIDLLNAVSLRYSRASHLNADHQGASDRYWRTLEIARKEFESAPASDLGALERYSHQLGFVVTGAGGYIDPARRERLIDEYIAVHSELEVRIASAMASDVAPETSRLLVLIDAWHGSCRMLALAIERAESGSPSAARAAALVERVGTFAESHGSSSDYATAGESVMEEMRAGFKRHAERADRIPGSVLPARGTEWGEV
jgi:hypothetical protein